MEFYTSSETSVVPDWEWDPSFEKESLPRRLCSSSDWFGPPRCPSRQICAQTWAWRESINQSINQPIESQSINQSIDQSIESQSINQSIDQSEKYVWWVIEKCQNEIQKMELSLTFSVPSDEYDQWPAIRSPYWSTAPGKWYDWLRWSWGPCRPWQWATTGLEQCHHEVAWSRPTQ